MKNSAITRIGISPFSSEQHIGVYRSFLVNIFLAKYYNGVTYLRIDDTNPAHTANIDDLIDDMLLVIDDGLISPVPEDEGEIVYVGKNNIPAIFESCRAEIYQKYLDKLWGKGFLIETKDAVYFDCRKYVGLFGDRIDLPYPGKPNRVGYISKTLPKKVFPIVVNHGKRFLWHFTSTVDDHVLGVTHIIRAMDKIDNQVPQTILNNTLGFELPMFMYTKIMNSSETMPTVRELLNQGFTREVIQSYLYGTITGRAEKNYYTFEEALNDFSPKVISPGQFKFDINRLFSIQKSF